METPVQQGKFDGWAVVELFGHQKEVGYVTTEVFGAAVLFRVDTPELAEREYILKRPEWGQVRNGMLGGGEILEERRLPVGATVRRQPVPGKSRLVGVSAIYSIMPCTQEAAMHAIEELIPRALILIELPKADQPAQITLPGESAAQDRSFSCCGGNPEDGHDEGCENGEEEDDEP